MKKPHAQSCDQSVEALLEIHAAEAVEIAEIANVLASGETGIEPARIGQHADAHLDVTTILNGIESVDADTTATRFHHRTQSAERGRFAGTVEPD